MALSPASGIGRYLPTSRLVIRFVRHGCTNREFFHIVVAEDYKEQFAPVIEQLGSFDPMLNERDEKYLALNFERIRYWLGEGADLSTPVAELLGSAGFLPIHPRQYMRAWRARAKEEAEQKERDAIVAAAAAAEAFKEQADSSTPPPPTDSNTPESRAPEP